MSLFTLFCMSLVMFSSQVVFASLTHSLLFPFLDFSFLLPPAFRGICSLAPTPLLSQSPSVDGVGVEGPVGAKPSCFGFAFAFSSLSLSLRLFLFSSLNIWLPYRLEYVCRCSRCVHIIPLRPPLGVPSLPSTFLVLPLLINTL